MNAPILVVDDDDDAREGLVEALASEFGQVVAASNGQEALDLIREDGLRPALIILDLRMPVMDGVSFLQHRSIDPRLGSAPVIVLTAETSLVPCLAETVAAVLPKPVPLRRLLELVHTMLDEPALRQGRTRNMNRTAGGPTRPRDGIERRRH